MEVSVVSSASRLRVDKSGTRLRGAGGSGIEVGFWRRRLNQNGKRCLYLRKNQEKLASRMKTSERSSAARVERPAAWTMVWAVTEGAYSSSEAWRAERTAPRVSRNGTLAMMLYSQREYLKSRPVVMEGETRMVPGGARTKRRMAAAVSEPFSGTIMWRPNSELSRMKRERS